MSKRQKTPSPSIALPPLIAVEVSAEDIARQGVSFSANPVVTALQRRGLPVFSVGVDLAYIGGRQYIADLNSAEKMGHYMFGGEGLKPYVHILELSTPSKLEARQKLRSQVVEKTAGFRETREEK